MTWVLDLDGVVWRGNEPIPGAVDAIRHIKDHGIRVGYVTNNSTLGARDQVAKMASMGIETDVQDIVSAHDMLVQRIGSGKTVLCGAAPELARAIQGAGNIVMTPDEFIGDAGDARTVLQPTSVDFVVVGMRFDLTLLQMSVAVRAVLQCGALLAANRDPLYPFSSGMLVGTGSILAAIETATGITAETMGKPEQRMVDEMLARLPDAQLIVGDQLAMDGELARKARVDFALVASGVDGQRPSENINIPVTHKSATLATLVEALL